MLHVRDRQFLAGDRIILTRNAGLDPSPHRPDRVASRTERSV